MSHTEDMETLGAAVADLTKTLASKLQAANYPKPSFAADSPATFPLEDEIQKPRQQLIDTLTDLLHLATGPSDFLFLHGGLTWLQEPTTLDILNRFDFFTNVPLAGDASYSDVARAVGLPEALVRRVFRSAFTMRFFAPASPGSDRVVHTALSAHAARTPELRAWIGHHLEEGRAAHVQAVEALRRFSAGRDEPTEDLHETAFGLSWPFRKPDGRLTDFFSMGEDDPPRGKRFVDAMQASVGSPLVSGEEAIEKFDWEGLGKAIVVDVGGSDGALAVLLARRHANLRFTVQDLPRLEAQFLANLPADVSDRVTFRTHDFFEPQPQGADVFLMKHILHNWPDKYAVRILRNLVSALHRGGRILVCDGVVPGLAEAQSLPLSVRKGIAAADMHMLVCFNAAERTLADWQNLAKKADPRLSLAGAHALPGALVHLLEFVMEA
ncbi:6-hydroxytryprostatin B O-methyltransferase [Achaetomium macrosporum]|uniref:6-hydroxytryprostatin B O-methyltransferase n=1 Tax=Achaetomium macrosporum TaxID=79813 RepID=A0AAN7H477_9PEZI|nr:6-hydroxytryprostatin B O-methyltransferase [Achaetomium macrosporum]